MSKVTVITPAYNASEFIADTIKSVQRQTFTDWEMIIVDDCSNDDTFDIVRRFAKKDKRIRILKNSSNRGVAASRNRGLDNACGDYIAFLDADDLWLPHKLEKQLMFMERANYVLTYTNYKKFDSDTKKRYKKVIRAPKTMTAQRIYGDTSIGCLTVMVNRKLSGAFHMPLINHTEDNITWQKILSRNDVKGYRLDEVLALYREGNASMTSGKKKAALKQWETYREYYRFSIPKSAFYFSLYAFHAAKKHFI